MEMATCSIMNHTLIKFSLKTGDFTVRPRVCVGCDRGDRLVRAIYPKDITDKGTGGDPCNPLTQRGSLFHDRVNAAPGTPQDEIRIELRSSLCGCFDLKGFTGIDSSNRSSETIKERDSHRRGTDIN
jgi:hypothetical protein